MRKKNRKILSPFLSFLTSGGKHLLSGTQGEDRDRHNWWAEMDSDFGDAMVSSPQS